MSAAVSLHIRGVVGHGTVDLGGENDAVALTVALECLADDLLAAPPRVDVRGVDEVDLSIKGTVDDGVGIVGLGAQTEHHGAETEGADLDASPAEGSHLHRSRSYHPGGPIGARSG